MIELFIKLTNTLIPIQNDIITLCIKNAMIYRKLYYDIESSIILNYNSEPIDLEKKVHIIKNVGEINCNDKKSLNYLYKNLEKSFDESILEKINKLNCMLIDIYDEINDKSNFSFSYNPELNINKIFSATEIQFESFEYPNFIKRLLQYINLVICISNIKVFIIYSLSSYITNDEFELLKKETGLMNIIIINIEKFTNKSIVDYIIDEDNCIY